MIVKVQELYWPGCVQRKAGVSSPKWNITLLWKVGTNGHSSNLIYDFEISQQIHEVTWTKVKERDTKDELKKDERTHVKVQAYRPPSAIFEKLIISAYNIPWQKENKERDCDSWLFLTDPLLLLGQTPLAVLSFVLLTGGLQQIDLSPKEFLSEPFGEKVKKCHLKLSTAGCSHIISIPLPQVRPKLFQRLGTGQGGPLGPCSDDQGRKSVDKTVE